MGPFGSNIKVDCFVDSGVPVLNGSNLDGFTLKEESFRYVTEEKADSLKRANAKKGDIVITHRGTLGQIVYIPQNAKYERYVISQSQFRIRCNEHVLPEYLVFYFHTRVGQHKILSNASQVGVPALARPSTTFQQIEVELPDIEVQKKIVSILQSFNDKIELNNKINANLQQQAQAIFKSWFVDFEPFQDGEFVESELGPIPKGWKVISLENVCSVITKGTTPTTLKRRFTDCGINYIKAESISNAHFIDKNKIAYIDQETHELLSRSKIQENDILFTIAGTLGRFCMVDKENVPANTNQAVAIIRADISKIHPCVLYSYFLGDWHTEYCHTRVQQAVQANLSLGTLKNMQIPYPDEVTMEKYRSIVEPLIAEVQRTNRENVASENLRNALIPKLMNGEIDVEGVAD